MNRNVCLITLLAWSSLANAQVNSTVSERDYLADVPIVLSVSRLPQPLDETPGAVTLIDRDMIRLSGARDVADLLRLVPGFQTSTSFETGGPLASYHGAFGGFSGRMQVLVDGRSVYSPYLLGSIAPGLETVALQEIERIEVLRGSNSAAYGARAFLGVVNIVTRHTLDTLGSQASLAAGENGIADARARIGWRADGASYRLDVDRRADDGLSGSNGHNRINRVNFRADLLTRANDNVEVRAGGLVIDSGKGFPDRPDDALHDRSMGSGYAQLDWRRVLGKDEDLAFSLSRTEETYRDTFPFSLIPVGINGSIDIDYSGRSTNDSVSLQHTFRRGAQLRVVWGGEFRREQVSSRGIFNTDAVFVTDFTRLFGNAEWRPAPNWVFNAGAMAEHSSVSGDALAPRLMLNWHVADGQTLRAGVSKAYRPPSTYEMNSDTRYVWNGTLLKITALASGAVQPESVQTRELGYLGEFPRLALNLDVRVFHEQIDNFVRATKTVPRDFVNDENFAIQGAEYQLKWRPWAGAQLVFNQTYTQIRSVDAGSASAAPGLASSLTCFQKLPGGFDLSLMHQQSGAMTLQGSGWDQQAAISRTDLRVAAPLRLGGRRGELALVIQNLGPAYQDYTPTFHFQRRAFVTLQMDI